MIRLKILAPAHNKETSVLGPLEWVGGQSFDAVQLDMRKTSSQSKILKNFLAELDKIYAKHPVRQFFLEPSHLNLKFAT